MNGTKDKYPRLFSCQIKIFFATFVFSGATRFDQLRGKYLEDYKGS